MLDKGRLVLKGTPQEVFSHDKELVALGLEEPFVARLAETLRNKGCDVPWTCDEGRLIEAIAGTTPHDSSPTSDTLASTQTNNPPAAPSDPVIRAQNLYYSYGDTDAREERHPALDNVSFDIKRGASVAIVGQTGSGKSTLLRLLCALESPDSGSLVVDGISTATRKQRRLLHGKVGYVMQHPERQLFAETVWEDVAYGPGNMKLSADEIERRCTEALALVGLTGRETSSPFHLSGGLQRLCALAGILAMEPSILVLDEPTAGLDPHGRTQLRTIIERIHQQGVTVVQVTHAMDDAACAEQVIVLDKGRLIMQGTPQEVFTPRTEPQLTACGLGIPSALSWSLNLAQQGVRVGTPLTLEELADGLQAHAVRGEHHGL